MFRRLIHSLLLVTSFGSWLYVIVLRRRLLRWGTKGDEVHRSLPGDDLVPHPTLEATRALTVHAGDGAGFAVTVLEPPG